MFAMPENEPQADPQTDPPPWGSDEDFNAEKAWKLIQDLKADKKKLSARKTLTEAQEAQLAEYEQISNAAKSDLDRKNEELQRWQSEADRWRSASLSARIEALAGPDFADPTDAISALADPTQYLDAGGQINEDAIKADLSAVLEKKPHWRRPEGAAETRVPAPNKAQGTSAAGAAPASPSAAFAAVMQQKLST